MVAGGVGNQMYLVKTDDEGSLEWEMNIGGAEDECAYCVRETADGGYIVVRMTESVGAGSGDVYLVKLGPPGASACRWPLYE